MNPTLKHYRISMKRREKLTSTMLLSCIFGDGNTETSRKRLKAVERNIQRRECSNFQFRSYRND